MSNEQDAADASLELEPEIAHLLLIDIVGYSTLSVNAQVEVVRELNRVVRDTECVRKADAQGRSLKVPTGDGMALLFFRSPEEPVRCALEIARTLKDHPQLQVRMGVHSGPVNTVTDVNDRANVAGAGINIAQRVMDCGDAGHILLSKHVADDIEQYRHWKPFLQDLGECEVKHGVRLHIFNLYKDGLGNRAVPQKLQRFRWRKAARSGMPHRVSPLSRAPPWLIGIGLLGLLAIALSLWFMFGRAPSSGALALISDKSVAVLPFRNVGVGSENAQLVDGIHNEVLTDLAKLADLKVISRTSVMRYRDAVAENLRDVGSALGVRYVVEGSVQRDDGRVRITAQLIDAQSDRNVWGEHYDRELADIFAIESDVAERIVAQLKAKLSPSVKAAIEQPPTSDLTAFELYARATDLIEKTIYSAGRASGLEESVRLLNEALKRDPNFFLAYFQLSRAHDQFYWLGLDHTPARLAMARSVIEQMQRLRPDAGETHLALARLRYFGYLDFDGARAEVALARRALPNDATALLLAGYIDRRQSRWEESTRDFEQALALDPQNVFIMRQLTRSYLCLRRYADAQKVLDRALLITPQDVELRCARAEIDIPWRADPKPLANSIALAIKEDPQIAGKFADRSLAVAVCERDAEAARRALAVLPPDGCYEENIPFPRTYCEGTTAGLAGDQAGAQAAFSKARAELRTLVEEQPNYAEALCALGVVDAKLGNKEDAIREGQRAVELLPVSKDSINGVLLLKYLSLIYAWTGEKDRAFEQLEMTLKLPGYLSYGDLKLSPEWDSLRGDPRFDKIVASLAPKP